jgi:hypothetical protein
VVGYVVHHYCLRIGGGVVHDAVVGYVVHHYCLRFGSGVVHVTVGYILYCPPLLFEVWRWSGSWCWMFSGRMIYTKKEEANFQTGRHFLFIKFKMNAKQVPQCKQSRVTYLLSYTYRYVRNLVWIETTVWLFLLYICHTVIHRKLQNVEYM